MAIITTLTTALFILAFMVTAVQYYVVNPSRRIINLRFQVMCGAIALAIAFVLLHRFYPDSLIISGAFPVLSLCWIGMALVLLRRMPTREA
ncbi:MAG: hypothetical protein JO227_09655 [Acetobacteraceae bacterium]|nr:hypothetical protein [Acetobacteraceae bacterium]